MAGKDQAAAVNSAAKVAGVPSLTVALFVVVAFLWISDYATVGNDILQSWKRTDLRISPPQSAATKLVRSPNASSWVMPESEMAERWVSYPPESNFTAKLQERVISLKTDPCHKARTGRISVSGIDSGGNTVLAVDKIHKLKILTYDEDGKPRCSGGDYFEVDLSGESWKSRPPVKDHKNGTYTLSLQLHPEFVGDYTLAIILLYRSYAGLKRHPTHFLFEKVVFNATITFRKELDSDSVSSPELRLCSASDFDVKNVWSGRWTRHERNDSCEIDNSGRYRCLNPDSLCRKPWCDGRLSSLESNGWVYSAHCSFRLFDNSEAWKCLAGKWIFFWGDSNHVDTIRNLINFVLGDWSVQSIPRRFDGIIRNPVNVSETVRITSIFNGHSNVSRNFEGLSSLNNSDYRNLIRSYFSESEMQPDVIVMNSGLHDGIHYRNLVGLAEAVEKAAEFWEGLLQGGQEKGLRKREVIYRTTVAVGGHGRGYGFNPQRMEAFNHIILEGFRRKGLLDKVVDGFDMTFPWHYDLRCSDGPHYGRPPAKERWRDGQIGHQYFVDLMLVHVLLNAMCPVS